MNTVCSAADDDCDDDDCDDDDDCIDDDCDDDEDNNDAVKVPNRKAETGITIPAHKLTIHSINLPPL